MSCSEVFGWSPPFPRQLGHEFRAAAVEARRPGPPSTAKFPGQPVSDSFAHWFSTRHMNRYLTELTERHNILGERLRYRDLVV